MGALEALLADCKGDGKITSRSARFEGFTPALRALRPTAPPLLTWHKR